MRTCIVASTVIALFMSFVPAKADLRGDLARRFGADPTYFILNLPPRQAGYPGSIYTHDMRFALHIGSADDNQISREADFDVVAGMSLEATGEASAGLRSLFGLSAAASETAVATVAIRNAQVLDLSLTQVRDRIVKLPDAQRRPPGPVVVYKAYEGVPTLTLVRRRGASAEAWAALSKGILDAGFAAAAAANDSIAVQSRNRMVFAFEVLQASDPVLAGQSRTQSESQSTEASSPSRGGAQGRPPTQTGSSSAPGVVQGGGTIISQGMTAGGSSAGISYNQIDPSTSFWLAQRVPAARFEAANPSPR